MKEVTVQLRNSEMAPQVWTQGGTLQVKWHGVSLFQRSLWWLIEGGGGLTAVDKETNEAATTVVQGKNRRAWIKQ